MNLFHAITHADNAKGLEWHRLGDSEATAPRQAAQEFAAQQPDESWEDDTIRVIVRCVATLPANIDGEDAPPVEFKLQPGQMWTVTVRRKTVYGVDTCREVKL